MPADVWTDVTDWLPAGGFWCVGLDDDQGGQPDLLLPDPGGRAALHEVGGASRELTQYGGRCC